MKKLSNGFTLAEVLITLALIGVIASMTLPNLNVNITKQQTGPALAKAINSLESANRLAIQGEGVRSLDQISEFHYLKTSLKKYLQLETSSNIKPYYTMSGTKADTPKNMYITKDGIAFFHDGTITDLKADQIKKLPIGYGGRYYTVYVDVNGNQKRPNIVGLDRFQLMVDTKGSVIPYGGRAWAAYNGGKVLWEGNGCGNSKKTPTAPTSCAGSIADNGFKVIY